MVVGLDGPPKGLRGDAVDIVGVGLATMDHREPVAGPLGRVTVKPALVPLDALEIGPKKATGDTMAGPPPQDADGLRVVFQTMGPARLPDVAGTSGRAVPDKTFSYHFKKNEKHA